MVQNNEGAEFGDEIEGTFKYKDDAIQANAYLISVTQPHSPFPELENEDDEHSNLV
jgi:hypothetical protein